VRVADESYTLEVFLSFIASFPGERAEQGLPAQRVQHLHIHDMGNVKALSGTFHLLPDALGSLALADEHGDHRRGVEDYQETLVDVTGIVGVPESANRHVGRLVKLDRLPLTQPLHHLG